MSWCSHAFLPRTVYQLEEFGLPRMISKKIQKSRIYSFTTELTIHQVIDDLNNIGLERISQIETLLDFDRYILTYFFDGIKVNDNSL